MAQCKHCNNELIFELQSDGPHYAKEYCSNCSYWRWVKKPKNEGKRYDNNRSHKNRHIQEKLKLICAICGVQQSHAIGESYFEVDHIIALSDEGPDTYDNTMILCRDCHQLKTALWRKTKKLRKLIADRQT